jgi:serine/threonine protein kinase
VLGDMGDARDTRIIMLNTEMGSIQYMSPEIVNESIIYTEKIDVW